MSLGNICTNSELRQIKINDLRAGVIQKDTLLIVKTISPALIMNCIGVCVEDEDGVVLEICMYNQLVEKEGQNRLEAAQAAFPKGTEIGIKQPFLKVSKTGYVILRNDNPDNIVVNPKRMRVASLKEQGTTWFEQGDYLNAIRCYKEAIKQMPSTMVGQKSWLSLR